MFTGCSKLTGTIPSDLFEDANNLGIITLGFSGCEGLTGEIPEGLFKDCTNITTIWGCFTNCKGLTKISAGLFEKNTKINDFNYMFNKCSGITSIPEGLFKNCVNAKSFLLTFADTSITEIPSDIFDINNGKENAITSVAGAFEGTKIKEIPEGIFDLCTSIENFGVYGWGYAGIFQGCTLLEKVPNKLFYNNVNAKVFQNIFAECTSLKEIPEDLFNTDKEVIMRSAFSGCTSLEKIPGNIFKNMPNITDYFRTFYNCKNLIEVGKEFSISESANSMCDMFTYCENLNTFPDRIYIPESSTDISAMFYNCNKLVTTIILKSNKIENYSGAFYKLNSSAKINWSKPCTEEIVDQILDASLNKTIKGIEE